MSCCHHHEEDNASDGSSDVAEMNHFNEIVSSFRNYELDCRCTDSTVGKFIRVNAEFLNSVVANASSVFGIPADTGSPITAERNVSKVRSTLKQFVREWALEGKSERDASFLPLLEGLKRLLPLGSFVLCPGSGLGRLPFEICKAGFNCQGNEFSYHMLLGSHFVLNELSAPNSVTIHPYVTSQSVTIPDELPLKTLGQMSMCAGEFVEVYEQQGLGIADGIVTCFFIDTAKNILLYIRTIANAIREGGVWLNLGPLLFHYAEQNDEISVELSWAEIRLLIGDFFHFIEEKHQIECRYSANPNNPTQTVYDCIYFAAWMDILSVFEILKIGEFLDDVSNFKGISKQFVCVHFLATQTLNIRSQHDMFFESFKKISKVATIYTVNLQHMGSSELLPVVQHLAISGLKHLAIECCILELEVVEEIAHQLLPHSPELESFSLVSCDWRYPSSLTTLLSTVFERPDLMEKLTTTISYQTEEGLFSAYAQHHWDLFKCGQILVVSLFRYCPKISQLSFTDSKISAIWRPFSAILCSFTSVLFAHMRTLQTLDLDCNALCDAHLESFFPGNELRSISLADNLLTDKTIDRIIDNWKCFDSKKIQINLSQNRICLKNSEKLCNFLNENGNVSFDLSNNPILNCPIRSQILFVSKSEPDVSEYVVVPETRNWKSFLEESCDESDDESYTGGSESSSDQDSSESLVSEMNSLQIL